MKFGINTTCDISKLSQISLSERLVKFRTTILKYHSWYLCQVSLQIMLLPILTILKYHLWYLCQISLQIMLLPTLIAGAIISFFAPKGGDYSREAIISDIVHWKSCPKYFVLPLNKKKNHIKETEHGLFKSSKFGSLINFHCQYPRRRHWSVLLDQTPLLPHPPDLPLWVSIAGYL